MASNHKPKTSDFSETFQQMASFVAIAKTRDINEILDRLVQQCFIIYPTSSFKVPGDFVKVVTDYFGIKLVEQDVAESLKRLKAKHILEELVGGHLTVALAVKQGLEARILEARDLEDEVRRAWLEQVLPKCPDVDVDKLWRALKVYLGKAFRRHGIQTVILLNPAANVAQEGLGGINATLDAVIKEDFPEAQRYFVRDAVASFFTTVRFDKKRAQYITQLADGAFHYFSLTVAPEVSRQLRLELNPLTLFLDTNFLFGILELHANSQVDVSKEMLEAVKQFKLPFKLRYHEATKREIQGTIAVFGGRLRQRKWPSHLSRAAIESVDMSGIEVRYHQVNAENPVDVGDFLAPYLHWEILLKDKGIDIYNVDSSERRLRARADLEAEYKDFLLKRNRTDKTVDVIQHDMAVLETVRSLRSNGKNTLQAGAILVTCDHVLFKFDLESSRASRKPCSVDLPSALWQIIRPFTVEDQEFDQAFAETFALPEFAIARGEAERAASRMLSILACYKNIPEATASKILANDYLLAQLQTKRTEEEGKELVESELIKENVTLSEEKASLIKKLESDEQRLQMAESEMHQKEEMLAQREKLLREKEEAIKTLEERERQESAKVKSAEILLAKEMAVKEEIRMQVGDISQQREDAEKRANFMSSVAGFSMAGLSAGGFYIAVHFILPWPWLLEHPNSYGLQAAFILMIVSGVLGFFIKSWRTWAWVVAFLGALITVIQLLGGPKG